MASKAHRQAQENARHASSVSTKSRTKAVKPEPSKELEKALKGVGQKILIFCTPWPMWTISGSWIAAASDEPAVGGITGTDDIGREILSYVPLPLVSDFLSTAGQALVSCLKPYLVFSILTNDPNGPQVTAAMQGSHSFHTNCLRTNGALIFGPGFKQSWFPSKTNRENNEMFQTLLGAHTTSEGKKYRLLPPILFPTGSTNRKDVFLNPALVRVSVPLIRHSLHSVLIKSRY